MENFCDSEITPIGITDWRDVHKRFGIKDKDRLGHIYVIGKTGTGKSTLLLNMAISDIQRRKGIALIDPHGDLAENILDYVPQNRIKDVIYFNTNDHDFPVGFNPLADVDPQFYHLVVSGLISAFKKIWTDSWGPRLEHTLRYALLTLLEYKDSTLLDIHPLLTDPLFRSKVISQIMSPHLLSFWNNEHSKSSAGFRSEAVAPILNKLGIFHSSETLRNIFGQRGQTISIQNILEEGKVLLVNLAKGVIGEDVCGLLGSILVSAFQNAALYRAKKSEQERKPFYLYIDEMQNFVSLSFADALSEARKYGLGLFLAHQYIDQLHEQIRSAIFGNVGTMISFRVGAPDARYLAKEFPIFMDFDFIHLPRYSMYIKLMIDGATSVPFSAISLPLPERKEGCKEIIVARSREQYAKLRKEVEESLTHHIGEEKKEREGITLF